MAGILGLSRSRTFRDPEKPPPHGEGLFSYHDQPQRLSFPLGPTIPRPAPSTRPYRWTEREGGNHTQVMNTEQFGEVPRAREGRCHDVDTG